MHFITFIHDVRSHCGLCAAHHFFIAIFVAFSLPAVLVAFSLPAVFVAFLLPAVFVAFSLPAVLVAFFVAFRLEYSTWLESAMYFHALLFSDFVFLYQSGTHFVGTAPYFACLLF